VDCDKSICIGCQACIAACPYNAIFINLEDHSAERGVPTAGRFLSANVIDCEANEIRTSQPCNPTFPFLTCARTDSRLSAMIFSLASQ
jgi:Fe-S-cluster-containing dehydrogenase component